MTTPDDSIVRYRLFQQWQAKQQARADYTRHRKLAPRSEIGDPEESSEHLYLTPSERDELLDRWDTRNQFGVFKRHRKGEEAKRKAWLKLKEKTFFEGLTQEERDYIEKGTTYEAVTPDFIGEAKKEQFRKERSRSRWGEGATEDPTEELLNLGIGKETSWAEGIGDPAQYSRRLQDITRLREQADLLAQMEGRSSSNYVTRAAVEAERAELYQFLKVPVLEAVDDCGQTHIGDEEKGEWCTGAEIYSSFINSYGSIRVPTIAGVSTRLPDSRAFFWQVLGGMVAGKTPLLETQYMSPTHYTKKRIRMFKLSPRGEEALRSGLN